MINENKPEYSLEESVDFAIENEACELRGESKIDAMHYALRNAQIYADQYGYDVDEFKAELKRRGAVALCTHKETRTFRYSKKVHGKSGYYRICRACHATVMDTTTAR